MWGGDGQDESRQEYQVIVCSFDDKFVAHEDSEAFVANPGGCRRELCCPGFPCLTETASPVIAVRVLALLRRLPLFKSMFVHVL